jgi:DNA-directed RNA polymerase subunit RPC12/RpoP
MIDNLITCPECGIQDSCYVTPINEFHNFYVCLNCGFQTSDLMRQGEFDFDEYEKELPELYKDIKRVDGEGRVWYPHIINLEGKGTVFANGSSKDDWQWSAIKSVPLTEEEKESPRFKGKLFKSDSKTLQNFGKDYFEACDYIGFFDVQLN